MVQKKSLTRCELFLERDKHFYYKLFLGIKKKREVLFCDHGSLPLTCRCCSTRLLRCTSMCLALSQVSLHRDVCPRLSDSNLSNRDAVSATQTCLCRMCHVQEVAFSVSLRIALDFITMLLPLSCNKT